MKFYGDNATPTQLYIYIPAYSKFIVRFINRVPADNTITLEDVTSTVSTSDLVELWLKILPLDPGGRTYRDIKNKFKSRNAGNGLKYI